MNRRSVCLFMAARSESAALSHAKLPLPRVSIAGIRVAHYVDVSQGLERRWIPFKGGKSWSVTTEQRDGNHLRPPHPDAGDRITVVLRIVDQAAFDEWPAARRRLYSQKSRSGIVAYASFGGQTVGGVRPARGTVTFFP